METNINILQKRIEERAFERFNRDFNELAKVIAENPIGGRLKICDNRLANMSGYAGGAILNRGHLDKVSNEITNIVEVKDFLMKEYIKQETDAILRDISILNSFLGNENKYEN